MELPDTELPVSPLSSLDSPLGQDGTGSIREPEACPV